jgi:UDP:flavonoid glycosyltransferase YjiC (YdhE family)
MRIMICTRSGAGHVGPLIPFAKAFLRNNDEVIVTAPADAAALIADAGLDHHVIPAPPRHNREAKFARARQMNVDDANAFVVGELFIRIDARAGFPHMLSAIETHRPDAILFDASDFAAALAAEATGVPAVCVGITQASLMDGLNATLAEALDEVRAVYGLEPDPELERLRAFPYFTLIPEALEDPATAALGDGVRFREVPTEPRPLPDWWENSDWPLVYLTFGSVAPTMDFFPGLYRQALDALALLPVRVLVTVGRDRDPAELGPLPPSVHAARWVPHADVMPHIAAMVCHGGSGTVTAGLAAGVPMAVVPLFADQPHNAKRVAELGAGIALDGPTRLTDAVGSLLADPGYRETARRIAEATEQLPTVDAAPLIVQQLAVAV